MNTEAAKTETQTIMKPFCMSTQKAVCMKSVHRFWERTHFVTLSSVLRRFDAVVKLVSN